MLTLDCLSIRFRSYTGLFRQGESCPLTDLSLHLDAGRLHALVGESGSGKSLLAHAIFGLLPPNASLEGLIRFKGQPLTPARRAALRGREMTLIPQSVGCLNPMLSAARQVRRAGHLAGIPPGEMDAALDSAWEFFQLPEAARRQRPHQLSGGMARRIMAAAATIGNADLIVADEPTNGLHPELVADTLGLLRRFADKGKTVLLITHDLQAAMEVADAFTVLRAGQCLETVDAECFRRGEGLAHPYTRALRNALPIHQFMDGLDTGGECHA